MADIKTDIKVNQPKVKKFRVNGKTLKDALKSLNARDEWGLYDSTQNQKNTAKTDSSGAIMAVKIEINPIIELPEWGGYSAANKAQKASWDSMIKKLDAHERKHHEIQRACATELEKAIQKAKSLDADSLNDLISKQQDACQKKQDAYDASSGHGAKEGVTLDLDADP